MAWERPTVSLSPFFSAPNPTIFTFLWKILCRHLLRRKRSNCVGWLTSLKLGRGGQKQPFLTYGSRFHWGRFVNLGTSSLWGLLFFGSQAFVVMHQLDVGFWPIENDCVQRSGRNIFIRNNPVDPIRQCELIEFLSLIMSSLSRSCSSVFFKNSPPNIGTPNQIAVGLVWDFRRRTSEKFSTFQRSHHFTQIIGKEGKKAYISQLITSLSLTW